MGNLITWIIAVPIIGSSIYILIKNMKKMKKNMSGDCSGCSGCSEHNCANKNKCF